MEKNNLSEELKQIMKKEDLSWQKFNDKVGSRDRSNLRRNLLGWLANANEVLNKIGYKISIEPIDKDSKEK